MIKYPAYKIAAAHVAPVFLDVDASIAKACSLIEEAASHGARLIAFPEAYIPGFPVWSGIRAPLHNHEFFCKLAANSMKVPGPELAQVCATTRRCGVYVSLGFNEGSDVSVGCIWNSNVLIGEDGKILNHHRKLVPTFWEKMTWANGDGAGLQVSDTSLGRIGMLICGENINTLARFTLMAQGEQVHISTYPAVWPVRDPKDAQHYNFAEAVRIRSLAHCLEAKVFNIIAAGFMDTKMRDTLAAGDPELARILDESPKGVSMALSPTCEQIGGVLCEEEGILYAAINLAQCVEPKQLHDLVGYYNRFDIFKLTVDRSPNRPITFETAGTEHAPAQTAHMFAEKEDRTAKAA